MAAERFIGGLRMLPQGTKRPRVLLWLVWSPRLNASRPLAELVVDDQRVVLRLRWGWARAFGRVFFLGMRTSWDAPRDSVAAEAFGRNFMTTGVLLRSPGTPPAIFWCSDQTRHAVLATLQTQASSA